MHMHIGQIFIQVIWHSVVSINKICKGYEWFFIPGSIMWRISRHERAAEHAIKISKKIVIVAKVATILLIIK